MRFKYTIKVPSTSKDILATEITTSQQKEYLKALLQSDNYEFCRSLYDLLGETLEGTDIDDLTLIDKLTILLHQRVMSIGADIEYTLHCDKCKKEIKSSLDLPTIVNKLYEIDKVEDIIIRHDQFSLIIGLPTIKNELILQKEGLFSAANYINTPEDVTNYFNKNLLLFGKTILVSDTAPVKIDLTVLSTSERLSIFESLPLKLLKQVQEEIDSIKSKIAIQLLDINCPCGNKILDTKLVIDSIEYSSFLKSVFNDNLHNIYQNIYYMTTVLHFSQEYIEKMTPNERDLYWGYFERDEKKKRQTQQDIPVANH